MFTFAANHQRRLATIGKDIATAAGLLRQGELVAIPTETVYGLAANALDPAALSKVFEVKNRPFFDPLIVHIHEWESVLTYADSIPDQAKKLADHFWPGPLTLLLNRNNKIPDLATAGLERVGLRCPDHPLTLALLKSLPFPLAAPSANPFGYVSPTTPAHVENQLGEKIPYILDGGDCNIGIESTVMGWEGKEAVVYRLGGITTEEIEKIIGTVKIMPYSTSEPQSPGQIKSHYSPMKPFILGNLNELIKEYKDRRVGILTFKNAQHFTGANSLVLSPSGNLSEAAHHLFASLRKLDEMNVEVILAEPVPNDGIGRAINDRLRRAAARG